VRAWLRRRRRHSRKPSLIALNARPSTFAAFDANKIAVEVVSAEDGEAVVEVDASEAGQGTLEMVESNFGVRMKSIPPLHFRWHSRVTVPRPLTSSRCLPPVVTVCASGPPSRNPPTPWSSASAADTCRGALFPSSSPSFAKEEEENPSILRVPAICLSSWRKRKKKKGIRRPEEEEEEKNPPLGRNEAKGPASFTIPRTFLRPFTKISPGWWAFPASVWSHSKVFR